MVTVLRPLSTSELLDRTFHLYRNHFLVFVGIAAIPQLFVLCIQLTFRFKPDPLNIATTLLASVGMWLLMIVATVFTHAATVVAVSELHLDKPAKIGTAYSVAKPRLLRVLGIALTVIFLPLLIILPVGVVLGIIVGVVGALVLRGGGMDNVTLIRSAALLAPVFILLTCLVCLRWWLSWSLVVPVTVLERIGFWATLRRSKELTKGRRLRILGVYVLIAVLVVVVSWVIQAPVLLVTGLKMFRDPAHISTGAQIASYIGAFVSASLVGGLATIALTLIYYDQRVRKEGFDLQLMMSTMQAGPPAVAAVAAPNS